MVNKVKKLYVFNKNKSNELVSLSNSYLYQIKKNYFKKNDQTALEESRNQLVNFIQYYQLDCWDEFDLGELEKYIDEYPQVEDALINTILDDSCLKSLLNVLNEISNQRYEGLKRFIRYNLKQEDVVIYSTYLA